MEDKYFSGITVHENEKAIPVQYKLKPGQNGPGNNGKALWFYTNLEELKNILPAKYFIFNSIWWVRYCC